MTEDSPLVRLSAALSKLADHGAKVRSAAVELDVMRQSVRPETPITTNVHGLSLKGLDLMKVATIRLDDRMEELENLVTDIGEAVLAVLEEGSLTEGETLQ
jgi:hypothetical protein